MTFGEMVASIIKWSREAGEPDIAGDALNDAIEKASDNILCVRLGDQMGGPVTLNLAQSTERTTLITVPDPLDAPVCAATPNSAATMPIRTVQVVFTLITPSGSETNPSPVTNFSIPANNLLVVSSPSTSDTTGNIVYGWMVYMLVTSPDAGQQWQRLNALPLPFGQSFVEPLLQPGDSFPNIPLPLMNETGDTIFYIDHLEIQRPDMTWKAWDQGDIDGAALRRAAGVIAATSLYQNYAFDVVNGSQIEIRPQTSMAINPRYFYVRRPGRIAFDSVQLPFQNISSIIGYYRYESLKLLFMSLNEPEQAAMWGGQSDTTMAQIKITQTRTRARTEIRVQHFRGMM